MMSDTYFIVALISYIISGAFLITSIILFITLHIKDVIKDLNGSLEQKQIEEIRLKNNSASKLRGKVNVFEELEKKAKPRRSNTASIKLGDSTGERAVQNQVIPNSLNPGTTLFKKSAKAVNSNFIIEKNLIFVSTNEVI